MAVCLFVSCDTGVVYHRYHSVAAGGWEKRDTFRFTVDTIRSAGTYVTLLCLRATAAYPYQNLSVRAIQTRRPDGMALSRVLRLGIHDAHGAPQGDGITLYTYETVIDTVTLSPGDTLHVKVGHNMRRETMPGITDVGVRINGPLQPPLTGETFE